MGVSTTDIAYAFTYLICVGLFVVGGLAIQTSGAEIVVFSNSNV
jgi:hypothetical protein